MNANNFNYLCNLMDITLSNLTIGYKHKIVAKDINTSIGAGQLTCLIGPNGVGKSTLLRTISGFQKPIEGLVAIDGKTVSKLSNTERAMLVSVVLTSRPTVSRLTAWEMVGMGRSPFTGFLGKLRGKDREAVEKAMEMTGTTKLAQRMTEDLSDGESQKIMIAKALAQQTPVMLLDEPTAFLDFDSRVDLMRLLAQLAHETGKTILLSTHDLGLACRLGDRLLELQADGITDKTKKEVEESINKI